jgi:hypothetical protein
MPKRTSKQGRLPDPNQLAFRIVQGITGGAAPVQDTEPSADGKNPAAVALGKLGGAKGGAARAAKLSKKRRAEIAKKAATARWKSTKS